MRTVDGSRVFQDRARRWLAASAVVLFGAAIAWLIADLARPEGGVDGPIARDTAWELVAVTGIAVIGALMPTGWLRFVDRTVGELLDRRPRTSAVVGSAVIAGLALLTTDQIQFGEGALGVGYGHDGVEYGKMAERFYDESLRVAPPFSFRVLPPLLVHYSGLDTFHGFFVLDLACFAASCVLVARIARALGAAPALSAYLVLLFASLKFGLKMWVYYPVSADAAGVMFGLLLVDATLRRNHLVYVLGLVAAIFVRENLLAVAVFHVLHSFRTRKSGWDVAVSLALQAVPVAVFVWIREQPPIIEHSQVWDPWALVQTWGERFLFVPGRQQMVLYGWINALGLLVLLPAFGARGTARFLVLEWEFAWLLVATALVGPMSGADYDRFAMWLVPVLVAAVVRSGVWAKLAGRGAVVLLLLHVVGSEVWQRWDTYEHYYLSRYAAHPVGHAFHYLSLAVWAFVVGAVALHVRAVTGRPADAR